MSDSERTRTEFTHAWDAYREYAWGADELKPLTLAPGNWYEEPLLLTPVDVLDALHILEFDEDAEATRKLIVDRLRFDRDIAVNVFETTIRVMGGLLSGFQFSHDHRLLELADDLARRLLPAFDTPTGLPYRYVNLATGAVTGTDTNPAEAGTLILEFGLLSDLTGNPVFRECAMRSLEALFERRSQLDLVGAGIDAVTGQWFDPSSHIAGLIDSYYEYLLKGWRLFGDDDLKSMWDVHLPALLEHVVTEHDGRTWCRRVDMTSGRELAAHYGALDAFFTGTLVLAGETDTAAALQQSGMAMWNIYGLEAERFDYKKMDVAGTGEDDGAYYLRPELAESAYYLYWATGESRYRDMGVVILDSLVRHCRTDHAYAAVSDIRTMEKLDSMESFFLAETLKYLYLLFKDDGVKYLDEYVFTTEAHPLRREKGKERGETDGLVGRGG